MKRVGRRAKTIERRTRVGRDLEEAFKELAAFMRGEIELEGYDIADDMLKASRTRMIRHKVARRTLDS
jgi:putative transcriptional regulator